MTMKKLIFLLFGILMSITSICQVKLGLKFSPTFVNSRVDQFSDTLDIEGNGVDTRFSMGLVVDYALTDTYYFSSGINYLPKSVAIKIIGENGGSYTNSIEDYNLQYLQVPLSLKLFTNEIQPDMAVYFQVGITGEVKIFDEPAREEFELIEEFQMFDSSAILGAGLEYKVGVSTILFGGFTYNRGLANSIKTTIPLDEELAIRNTAFTIDLGIKF